ncbi:MAG: type II toxin-antitoxin system RelE/ParE family toxin [Dysgonamonadaceae bacterium]|jgi:plasmid stabilization system protein ParE|nr:type II toxin-antitoxin system RelE/ParE family toxin [Dysgonamonadaceae bacterium]
MKKFKIVYSQKAIADRENLFNTIVYEFYAPQTAFRYVQGMIDTIEKLHFFPEAFPIKPNSHFLMQYGSFVRTIIFKKMTIIYTVHNNTVYIHRIVASSLLTHL